MSEGDLNPETGEISPITDLNSKTGEKSPDRGVHADNDTPDGGAAARFPGALTLCPRVAAAQPGSLSVRLPEPGRARDPPYGVSRAWKISHCVDA